MCHIPSSGIIIIRMTLTCNSHGWMCHGLTSKWLDGRVMDLSLVLLVGLNKRKDSRNKGIFNNHISQQLKF